MSRGCTTRQRRDRQVAGQVVRELGLADKVDVLELDDGVRPRRRLLRCGRKWNLEGWRGSPLGTSWFDEYVEPLNLGRVVDHYRCEGVLCLDGHQAALDVGIASDMVAHQRENEAEARLVFTQAPPGLAGIILRREVTRELLEQDGELYILAKSDGRLSKERGMRRRRLKKLWKRLGELRQQKLSRDQLLLKVGAAKKEAGRVFALVDIRLPEKDQPVGPDRDRRTVYRLHRHGDPGRHRVLRISLRGRGIPMEDDRIELFSLQYSEPEQLPAETERRRKMSKFSRRFLFAWVSPINLFIFNF